MIIVSIFMLTTINLAEIVGIILKDIRIEEYVGLAHTLELNLKTIYSHH